MRPTREAQVGQRALKLKAYAPKYALSLPLSLSLSLPLPPPPPLSPSLSLSLSPDALLAHSNTTAMTQNGIARMNTISSSVHRLNAFFAPWNLCLCHCFARCHLP